MDGLGRAPYASRGSIASYIASRAADATAPGIRAILVRRCPNSRLTLSEPLCDIPNRLHKDSNPVPAVNSPPYPSSRRAPVVSSAAPAAASETSSLLAVRDLTKRYSGLVALSNYSLDLAPGTIHGVIGPNGARSSE